VNPSLAPLVDHFEPRFELGQHRIRGGGDGWFARGPCWWRGPCWRPSPANIVERALGDDIVRGGFEDQHELRLRLVDSAKLEERTAQGHSGREVRRMLIEAGPADPDGLLELAGPPVLLGKLRKRNRRRVLLDPASKIFNAWIVDHRLHYGTTVTILAVVDVPP